MNNNHKINSRQKSDFMPKNTLIQAESREKSLNRGQTSEKLSVQMQTAANPSIQEQSQAQVNVIRLNKAIADAGYCSRRKADDLIKQGLVSVNNVVVDNLGQKVNVSLDIICVNDVQLKYEKEYTYVMLNKPVQVMSTTSDPEGRQTVIDLLPKNLQHLRLFPVGRLDYFSEGLILLTNDGDLANKIIHPRHHLPKIYTVLTREQPTEKMIDIMQKGMTLSEGDVLAPVKAKVLRSTPRGTLVEMTLYQGINRQIRRMCRDLNLTILKIYRTKLGPLSLDYLERAKTRLLTKEEVAKLKQLT